MEIRRTDDAKREVFGEVAIPLPRFAPGQVVPLADIARYRAEGRIHHDGGCWTSDEIPPMAHRFLAVSRAIDREHDKRPGRGVPIESYVATADGEGIHEGAWGLRTLVNDDAAWAEVDRDELNAYSVRVITDIEPVAIEVEDEAGNHTPLTLSYFVNSDPREVSLVGAVRPPSTGLRFEVLRSVEELVENPNLLGRLLNALKPLADIYAEQVFHAVEVERSESKDFATQWKDSGPSANLNRAMMMLQDSLFYRFYEAKEGADAKPVDLKAVAKDIDQFKAVILEALGSVQRSEGDACALLPTENSIDALLDHVAARKGPDVDAGKRAQFDAAIEVMRTAAGDLRAAMVKEPEGTVEVARNTEDEMDEATKKVLADIQAGQTEILTRLTAVETERAAPAPDAELKATLDEIRAGQAGIVERLEKVEKRRSVAQSGGDDPTPVVAVPVDGKKALADVFRRQACAPAASPAADDAE